MRFDANAKPGGMPSSKSGRRTAGRHLQYTLRCNLGDVIDISPQGMRVRCQKLPNPHVEVVIYEFTQKGQLIGNVVWTKPSGTFHHEVGLKFEKVSSEVSRKLSEIAKNHRFRRAS